MKPEWNALYVKHNHEKAASRFLAAHGVDHYLPLYRERSAWSNRQRVVVERPVFPGYLFVRFTPEQRRKVLMAPGVVYLTSECEFGTMTTVEIARLRKAIARGEEPRLPHFLESHSLTMRHRSQTAVPVSSADTDGPAYAADLPHTVAQ